MCASSSSRRAVAEISAGGGSAFNIGNRSIHQFWHLFSSNFRSVLLPPQRRPDSGSIAWNWREPAQNAPLTAQELAAVRQRLNDGSRVFSGGGKGKVLIDDASGNLDSQVREKVGEMVAQLIARGDQALAGFVCRTETGPMVHSWGAATPATPHYPGTSEGAVSGTVFLGENRPAGLSVVLENRTGGFVARTKSGDAGAFSFSNVAPGSYRVRVTGREGFSAGGVAVTVEREPVTGIELRGKTGEDGAPVPAASVTTPPMAVETTPSRLPRLIGGLALLAVFVGGGVYYWRTTKQPANVAANDPKQSGWQSASGQLASGASQPTSTDTRKVGADGRFSKLSAAPSLPTNTASISAKPGSTTAAEKNKAGLTPQDRPASTETASASKEPAAPDEPGEAKTAQAEKSAAESAAKAKTKAPRPAPPGAPSLTDGTAADALPSGAAEPDSAAPTAAAASSVAASKSANPAAAKNAPGSGPNATAPAADASDAAADSPDSPAPGAAADSAAKSASGKSPASAKSPAANASASPASASPAENTAPDPSTDSANQSSDPASSTKNNPAKKSASAPKRPPGATPADSSTLPDATAPDDIPADSPAAANAGKSAAKPARPSATKTASASPETKASTAADSGDTPAASPEPDSDSPVPGSKSSARSKPPQKIQPASPAESGSDGSPVAAAKPVIHEPLFPLARISASDWKPRQVRDLILPTQPVPASEDDAVQALREKLRLEQRARMPQTFRQPVVTSGFAVEFLTSPSIEPPRWRDANGALPAGATVQGNRAEIGWSGPNPAGSIDYVLSYPDGREIARVHTDGDGAPSLAAAANVRGWYWVGITRSPTDNKVASASPQSAPRLDWRLLSGAAVPASWPQRDQWSAGQGHRLEIPLGASSADKRPYSLALVDQVTGWALVGEIRVR